jgi:hypothetical protein
MTKEEIEWDTREEEEEEEEGGVCALQQTFK